MPTPLAEEIDERLALSKEDLYTTRMPSSLHMVTIFSAIIIAWSLDSIWQGPAITFKGASL